MKDHTIPNLSPVTTSAGKGPIVNDIHSVLVETQAYVEGLRNLTVESDGTFNHLTAFQFDMLLRPISDALTQGLVALEEDRKVRRRTE
jgi:hypothetical protein